VDDAEWELVVKPGPVDLHRTDRPLGYGTPHAPGADTVWVGCSASDRHGNGFSCLVEGAGWLVTWPDSIDGRRQTRATIDWSVAQAGDTIGVQIYRAADNSRLADGIARIESTRSQHLGSEPFDTWTVAIYERAWYFANR
jgi:hypothetical protein